MSAAASPTGRRRSCRRGGARRRPGSRAPARPPAASRSSSARPRGARPPARGSAAGAAWSRRRPSTGSARAPGRRSPVRKPVGTRRTEAPSHRYMRFGRAGRRHALYADLRDREEGTTVPNVFGAPHKGTGPDAQQDHSPVPPGVSRFGTHEQVVFCQDEASGLRAIIAIYSTALGPSLGGTRFYPYASEEEALSDVLNLSRGMAYKAALAGLDLGGGKAVIIGDPATEKTEAKLRASGRFVQSLNGRYYTACDIGTYSEDMDVIARECRFVTGRTVEHGGAGDSSILTAFGVYQGMRAAAETVWGSPTLRGKRVGVEGVGKVGHRLVEHLREDGADIVICDVDEAAIDRVRSLHPEVEVVADSDEMIRTDLDVYAPCALGGSLNDETVPVLKAKVV